MNEEEIREKLLEHARSEKNGIFPEDINHEAQKINPLCGDHVELRLKVQDGIIQNIGFKAEACAICSASASVLSQEVGGEKVETVIGWIKLFENTIAQTEIGQWPSEIQFLCYFEHIKVTPSRKMCALLPWVVLKTALK